MYSRAIFPILRLDLPSYILTATYIYHRRSDTLSVFNTRTIGWQISDFQIHYVVTLRVGVINPSTALGFRNLDLQLAVKNKIRRQAHHRPYFIL